MITNQPILAIQENSILQYSSVARQCFCWTQSVNACDFNTIAYETDSANLWHGWIKNQAFYRSHLISPVFFGLFCISIMVGLQQYKMVREWMNGEFPRGILQAGRHLVKHSSQLLQRQNPASDNQNKRKLQNKIRWSKNHTSTYCQKWRQSLQDIVPMRNLMQIPVGHKKEESNEICSGIDNLTTFD